MKRIFWKTVLLGIALTLSLSSCGGGGGGGGGEVPGDAVVYSGATGQTAITETNAKDLVLGAFYGGPGISTIAAVPASVSNSPANETLDPRLLKFSSAILDSLMQQELIGAVSPKPMAIVPITDTTPGNCGGSEVANLNVNDSTGEFNGTLQFNSYCEDATTISGTVNVSGTIDPFTLNMVQMNMSFTSLTVTSGGDSVTMSGSYVLTSMTMTMNHRIRDNATRIVYKIESYTVTETDGIDWTETTFSSGRYYHPDYGYVELSTISPFRLYLSDFGPATGQLQIAGANGSKALLTAISSTLFEVTADIDGDGTYEWSSGLLRWSDVNTVPVANGGSDQFVTTGSTVPLNGSDSFDADLDPLSYSWMLLSKPFGSNATLTAPQSVSPSFVADLDGTYVIALTVNDGTINSAEDQITVTAQKDIALLNYQVGDAEYSKALDRLIIVSSGPANRLHIINPLTATDTAVDLPLAPSSVSVSPDGLYAAVGHNAWISYIDLTTATLVKTFAVSTDVLDIVLAGNGYVYAFPRTDQWEYIRGVNIATAVETLSTGMQIYAGTLAKLHPNGTAIYGADNGLSPSDIEKYDISTGTATYLYDSPYHGDYPMCGDLWISEDGLRVFTKCGNVFRSSSVQAEDMLYNGSLGTNIEHLDHSATAGKVITIPAATTFPAPGTEDTQLRIYAYDFLTLETSVPFPTIPLGGQTYSVHGKYVFFSADGSHYYAIVQADSSAGLVNDYGVIAY